LVRRPGCSYCSVDRCSSGVRRIQRDLNTPCFRRPLRWHARRSDVFGFDRRCRVRWVCSHPSLFSKAGTPVPTPEGEDAALLLRAKCRTVQSKRRLTQVGAFSSVKRLSNTDTRRAQIRLRPFKGVLPEFSQVLGGADCPSQFQWWSDLLGIRSTVRRLSRQWPSFGPVRSWQLRGRLVPSTSC
jgi:hypothetical protein